MSTIASLRRALVGRSRILSSSKVGDVFGSSSELNGACGLDSKLVICGYSRQFGSRPPPREQEDDFTPPKPRWEAGKQGEERYSNSTRRDAWSRGRRDGRGQGREDKVSSYGQGGPSNTPNATSRTSSPRQSSSQFVSDWSGSAGNSNGTAVRPRAKNPLIERLKRIHAEIAKDEADAAAALALAAEKAKKEAGDGLGPSSEGDSLGPSSDIGSGTQFEQKV